MMTSSAKQDTNPSKQESKAWILGHSYPSASEDAFRTHCEAFFRFTYRRDFPAFQPYAISSDSGWGCMLRAAQMLMGYALRRHYLGTDWRLPKHREGLVRLSSDYRNLLTWFLDYPGYPHFYSLHHFLQCGMKYDKLPGEWFGPSTVSYVLRDLATLHCTKYQGQVTVLVTQSETIYVSEAEQLCCNPALNDCLLGITESVATTETLQTQKQLFQRQTLHFSPSQNTFPTLPTTSNSQKTASSVTEQPSEKKTAETASNFFDPLCHPPPSEISPWMYSLVVLIPLRLGIHSLLPEYIPEIQALLRNPHCIGILGGRVNHAIYFLGYQDRLLYGHDPHVVYATPSLETFQHTTAASSTTSAHASAMLDYLNQLHTPEIVTLDFQYLDPSLTIAFYFPTREVFHTFCTETRQRTEKLQAAGVQPLYRVEQTPPSYLSSSQSRYEDMMEEDEEEDEEESVLGGVRKKGSEEDSMDGDGMEGEGKSKKAQKKKQLAMNLAADVDDEKDEEYVFL